MLERTSRGTLASIQLSPVLHPRCQAHGEEPPSSPPLVNRVTLSQQGPDTTEQTQAIHIVSHPNSQPTDSLSMRRW